MRRLGLTLGLAGLLVLAGCDGNDDETPAGCLEGARAYVGALEKAPGEVLLGGEVPISECLAENQQGGDLATVGGAMLKAANELNAEAREDPGGDANFELGYLLGAAESGAANTSGIHAELIRRLEAAALYSPAGRPLPEGFEEAYREGYDAGRSEG